MLEKHPIMGHWLFTIPFMFSQLKKRIKRYLYNLTDFDYSKISAIEVDGIDTSDYPDFCDAYITYAEYKGKPMSERQLERLNENSQFVYECVTEKLY